MLSIDNNARAIAFKTFLKGCVSMYGNKTGHDLQTRFKLMQIVATLYHLTF